MPCCLLFDWLMSARMKTISEQHKRVFAILRQHSSVYACFVFWMIKDLIFFIIVLNCQETNETITNNLICSWAYFEVICSKLCHLVTGMLCLLWKICLVQCTKVMEQVQMLARTRTWAWLIFQQINPSFIWSWNNILAQKHSVLQKTDLGQCLNCMIWPILKQFFSVLCLAAFLGKGLKASEIQMEQTILWSLDADFCS